MLRSTPARQAVLRFSQIRTYVSDPFNAEKPTSQTHATEKDHKERNIQSDAVEKGMKDKKESGIEGGKKQTPEKTTKAPGPVLGMQDERGGVET